MIQSLNKFIDIAKKGTKKRLVVAAAEDEHVLGAIKDAISNDIIIPIFVGNTSKIEGIAQKIDFDSTGIEIIEAENPIKSAQIAVQYIRDANAEILMKGLVNTADFLRAILHKDNGLRKGELLSHIGFFEVPAYPKLIALTDAAQNIFPDFNEKVSILKNSLDMFKHLGYECPKVACLAAIEGVNPKMPATIDAAALTQMNRRGQIKGCLIDGPLAFDNAISKLSAEHKGIVSDVAGDTDLLFAPNIEVANVLYKAFTYFAGATVAAIILGASVPIVLTSRSDSDKSKLMSIALAACY